MRSDHGLVLGMLMIAWRPGRSVKTGTMTMDLDDVKDS